MLVKREVMKKMFDSKKALINYIITGKDLVNSINKAGEDEEGYATYLTTNGWLVGKEFELDLIDLSKDNLKDELSSKIRDGKGIDAISIAVSMLAKAQKDYLEEHPENEVGSSRVIFLSDVTIKGNDGQTYNTNIFALFHDQIIGMIPGKMNLK